MTAAVIANGPMLLPGPMPGEYCQMMLLRAPVIAPGIGPASTPTRIVPIEST